MPAPPQSCGSLLLAALLCLGGCAARQLEVSERETGKILSELDATVEAQRAAARERTDAEQTPEATAVEVPEFVSLEDALRIAGRHNRDLLTERDGLTLSALQLLAAQNAIGPRLFGSVSWLLEGSDRREEIETLRGQLGATGVLPTGATLTVQGDTAKSTGRGDVFPTSADGGVEARLSQPLLRGFGYAASREALTDAQRQSLYDVRDFELSRQDLALDVQREYYGLVAQKQVIRNRELNLENFRFLLRRSERLFELDRVSEVDKFRAAREYLQAENQLIDARQEFAARLDRFKVLLGVDAGVSFDIVEEIPAPKSVALELAPAVSTALSNRLELMTARDLLEDAERHLRLRSQDLLPDLALEATTARLGGPDRGFSRIPPVDQDVYTVGIALELPLDRQLERNAVRAARIEVRRARRQLSLREDQVILDVREALRDLRSAEASLAIQEQIVVSEEKNVKIARLRFEEGEISNRDLTEALISLADARDRLVREQANLETARLELLRALGLLVVEEDGTWKE